MKRQSPPATVFGKWLERKVSAAAEHILEMLGEERLGEYGDLPQELVTAIHNEVLWQVVMRTNFPVNSLAPDQDTDKELVRYLEHSKEKAHVFFSLCKHLAAWCPGHGNSAVPVELGSSVADGAFHRPCEVDEGITTNTKQ